MSATKPTLWLLEDHLSHDLPLLHRHADAPVLLIESRHAMGMHPYHRHRLIFLVSAMRHFADELRSAGRTVAHYPLRQHGYMDSLAAIRDHIRRTNCRSFLVTEPSEYHTRVWIESLPDMLDIEIEFEPRTLLLTERQAFASWARRLKSPVMETFYRRMRKEHNVLMDRDQPIGGTWNLDTENRKPAPRSLRPPRPISFKPDAITRAVIADVERAFPDNPGDAGAFDLPVTRDQALEALNDFLDHRLPMFGDYEDAMLTDRPILYHSRLSPLLNAGLLLPMECIRAAEERFHEGKAPLNSVEGFVRQILGWREYVYGIYWSFMPEYRERNARRSTRPLPQCFWDGNCRMNCLKQTIGGVLESGYSHHIQRLMILCNFATLVGINPQAVNDWFLAMYIDSHDWVVTPNVIGMGMNADGGTMATKPYVSSAAYINRMSDYCAGCQYNPRTRTGEDACPFNYLYWTFLSHFRKQLGKNPRMSMILKHLDRIDPDEMRQMMKQRKQFIESL
ncbi:MAG TPA: cryptochrome/photolyase family protein [Tepidisphaeraceae bacterium]|nr:cryptochrome/photolyase family protein [Tepidisphaeraceae bacterium]